MNFKKIIAFVLSFFMVSITGCMKQKVVNEKQSDTIQGKITVWTDKDNLQALKLSAEGFKKIHDKAIIQVEEVNKTDLTTKLSTSLNIHSGVPNIILAQDEDIQLLLKNFSNSFRETSDDIKKDSYLKYKIDNLTRESKLFGIPLNSKPGMLVYRKDLYEAAGVNAEYIKTWGDFIIAGKAVVKNDKIPMLSLPLQEENCYRLFLNQLNSSYFDKNGNPVVDSENGIKAAEMLKTLYIQGIVQNINSSTNDVTLLTEGKVACAIVSLEQVTEFIKNFPGLKGKLGIMKLPAFEEGGNQAITLNGSNLLILNSSENLNLSIEFSKFTTENKDNLKLLLENVGMFPAFNNYYDEKWFSKEEPYFQNIKLWKLNADDAEDIYAINYTENFNVIASSIKDIMQSIILKGMDSKNALTDFQNKFKIVK